MPKPHALIVPASGQGHVNGCMLLARSLSSLGFSISFVYFSSYYNQLKQTKRLSSTQDPSICIHVVEDGLEAEKEHMPFEVTPAMKEGLAKLVEDLTLEDKAVTCLISDTFVPWTQDVADKAGIPRIDYWTSNAFAYLMIFTLPALFSKGLFPDKGSPKLWKSESPLMLDHVPGLPPFPSELYPKDIRFAQPSHPFVLFFVEIASTVKRAERILIHTLSELEPAPFQALQVANIPAYAIGPLLQHAKHEINPSLGGQQDCIQWLNTQAKASVIYIAFGSYASLSVEEIQELAIGLEASRQPFLWAIRADSYDGDLSTKVLPEGFLERTSGKGLIINWAPQVEVLAHSAVGGFLSHCGWNSTMESLWAGVPILCCPREAEQRSNSRNIAHLWKVGLELERTEEGGLERSFVEHGVKALMQDVAGREARCKALEVMQAAREACQEGGQSMANLQKFYVDMKLLCSTP